MNNKMTKGFPPADRRAAARAVKQPAPEYSRKPAPEHNKRGPRFFCELAVIIEPTAMPPTAPSAAAPSASPVLEPLLPQQDP